MNVSATYTIALSGPSFDVMDVIALLSEEIPNQQCFSNYELTNRFSDDADEDDDFDSTLLHREELLEIRNTNTCAWLEDIEAQAKKIVRISSEVTFCISGHIEDRVSDDLMNFTVRYNGKQLTSQHSDWYVHIHMRDFRDYQHFCRKFSDRYGCPRYTQEDYDAFCECADEWYVMNSGQGEFSNDVPLCDPVKIRLK